MSSLSFMFSSLTMAVCCAIISIIVLINTSMSGGDADGGEEEGEEGEGPSILISESDDIAKGEREREGGEVTRTVGLSGRGERGEER
jgi:hypothetical protein